MSTQNKIKPFVKWAGGKGRLLETLNKNLPSNFTEKQNITYIEPFVGGGAMLFHMLGHYQNIDKVIINDINPALINCYRQVKNNHISLIKELRKFHESYYNFDSNEGRRNFYYKLRDEYNKISVEKRNTIRAAALFIFFNKTCFNGLYRENNAGGFNVPFGRTGNPNICDEETINITHEVLQKVEILSGSYTEVTKLINWDEFNFFYFDPPYRPLLGSNNFNKYTLNSFDDSEQEELKTFCDKITDQGGLFMLSNSASEIEPGIGYFDNLYKGYNIQHIVAPRSINTLKSKEIKEVLITNYQP